MFDKILIVLSIFILNCVVKIYDIVNDVWIYDNIYLLIFNDIIKLIYEEFLEYIFKNIVLLNKCEKKFVKWVILIFYLYYDDYEFEF